MYLFFCIDVSDKTIDTRGLDGPTKFSPPQPKNKFKVLDSVRYKKSTRPDPTRKKLLSYFTSGPNSIRLIKNYSVVGRLNFDLIIQIILRIEIDSTRNNFTSSRTNFDPTRLRVL